MADLNYIQRDAREYRELVPPGATPLFIIDPPWDASLWDVAQGESNKLVFFDGGCCGAAIGSHGPPDWIFTWDCVSSWWTPNRPLRRAKYCAFYGDISKYDQSGAFVIDRDAKSRVVRNTRGEYIHHPAKGVRLSDVYSAPITKLHSQSTHRHTKPIDWITSLIGNCIGECDIVIDLFCGSGVAGEACSRLGFNYIGMDLDISNVGRFDPKQKTEQMELWNHGRKLREDE